MRRFAICLGAVLAVAAVMTLNPGCTCSSTWGGVGDPCETRDECDPGLICLDGTCQPEPPADGDVDADADADVDSDVDSDVDADADADEEPCRSISAESTLEPTPVDVIVAIDNSGSMSEEAAEVRRNMNRFAEILGESGLDYRVVLISRPDGSRGVCIPPPLGTGEPDCLGGEDGRLLPVHVAVASRNAPDIVLAQYPAYRDFLRESSTKVFLWVTDDESGVYSADGFREALAGLEPAGMFALTIHNSIVGYYGDGDPSEWADRSAGTCATLARVGATYLRLAQCLTDSNEVIEDCIPGRWARVCETDWTPVFESIAEGVVAGVPVVCDFVIPDPPEGQHLDYDDVRVTYTRGDGGREELERVESSEDCRDGAWRYDDPVAPTEILLCPELCARVQRDEGARMDVGLGCFPDLV